MDKIADGKYTIYRTYEGEKSKLGSLSIKDEAVSFTNEDDAHNLDMFPQGPMSARTKDVFAKCLKKEHNHITIEKK